MNQKSSVVQILKSVPQVLTSDTPHGMGFLDWTKGRRYFERSYREMSAALAVAARDSYDPMVQLAMVAEAINASGERDDQVPQ